MRDESDWKRAAAMTDEEIAATVATDPDEAGLDEEWMKNAVAARPDQRTRVFTHLMPMWWTTSKGMAEATRLA